MDEFAKVTVVKKANIFFGGGVTSRTILFPDGSKKTLGIMQPGEYHFDTRAAEVMEIMAGDLDVRLPGAEWRKVAPGESFDVPADTGFDLRVRVLADYCCSFVP
jgi:uncharacterized protein YaiE (UPF0345 family)